MSHLAGEHDTRQSRAARCRPTRQVAQDDFPFARTKSAECSDVDPLAIESDDRSEGCIAKAHGVLRNRIEDRLNVSRRTRDPLQDLARRCLLLKRLRHLSMGLRERLVLL